MYSGQVDKTEIIIFHYAACFLYASACIMKRNLGVSLSGSPMVAQLHTDHF